MSTIINTLRKYIPQYDVEAAEISKWSVGTQIEHCTKVIYGVCTSLKQSDPKLYQSKFHLIRTIYLFWGKFPRGKAKAPKAVTPTKVSTLEELNGYLEKAEAALNEIDQLSPNAHFKHPYFGMLNVKQGKRFLEIHTNHHIAIIEDIIKAKK
jgi:hypothetical protein